jgi:hypothetical protein
MAGDGPQGEEQRWVEELVRLTRTEVRLFFTTAAAFLLRPRRFGEDWVAGRLKPMSPAGFLAASWPVLLPLDYGLQRYLGWDRRPDVPLLVDAGRAIRPYLFIIPASVLLYGFFRALRSKRLFQTTLGILFYWMVWFAFVWVFGLLACVATGAGDRLPQVMSILSSLWGGQALAGAHRVHWAACTVALLVSTLGTIEALNWLLAQVGLA